MYQAQSIAPQASSPDHGDAHAYLRKAGLRPTSARAAIVDMLHEYRHQPLAAETLFRRLGERGVSISQGTIYRVLHELEYRGLLHREREEIDPKARLLYALAPASPPPAAYCCVCRGCGRAMPLEDKQFAETFYRLARSAGFDHMLSSLSMQGTCNDCAQALPQRPA